MRACEPHLGARGTQRIQDGVRPRVRPHTAHSDRPAYMSRLFQTQDGAKKSLPVTSRPKTMHAIGMCPPHTPGPRRKVPTLRLCTASSWPVGPNPLLGQRRSARASTLDAFRVWHGASPTSQSFESRHTLIHPRETRGELCVLCLELCNLRRLLPDLRRLLPDSLGELLRRLEPNNKDVLIPNREQTIFQVFDH